MAPMGLGLAVSCRRSPRREHDQREDREIRCTHTCQHGVDLGIRIHSERGGGHRSFRLGVIVPDPRSLSRLGVQLTVADLEVAAGGLVEGAV
jgi:hypothetical protein